MTIGFIGQGYIGKNYADDFEARGHTVMRYSLEPEYAHNRELIASCDVVFVAVPTPTKPEGFDYSIVEGVLSLIGEGKICVIKSTLIPGTSQKLQALYSHIFLLHSPEFLSRATALEDAKYPRRNIVGVTVDNEIYRAKAEEVMKLLPKAPYELITVSDESELLKYINNTFFYTKTVFMNMLYDLATAHGCSWDRIKDAMSHEPWIGTTHIDPVHRSGRGAGGPCFIKDFKAFTEHYAELLEDPSGLVLLRAIEQKNLGLLTESGKDLSELRSVYGDSLI